MPKATINPSITVEALESPTLAAVVAAAVSEGLDMLARQYDTEDGWTPIRRATLDAARAHAWQLVAATKPAEG